MWTKNPDNSDPSIQLQRMRNAHLKKIDEVTAEDNLKKDEKAAEVPKTRIGISTMPPNLSLNDVWRHQNDEFNVENGDQK